MTRIRQLTHKDMREDNRPDTPFLRISNTNDIQLSNSWVNVDFDDETQATFDQSFFDDIVNWDDTNKMVTFSGGNTRKYDWVMNMHIDGGDRPASLSYRFIIPGQTDIVFPFPDGRQQADLIQLERIKEWSGRWSVPVRATSEVVATGLKIQIKVNETWTNYPILKDVILEVYGN